MVKEDYKIAPGPKGSFLLGSLKEVANDPIKLFKETVEEYGDISRLIFPRLIAHIVNSTSGIRHVLQENGTNYTKAKTYKKLKPILGEGLLTSEGKQWLKNRRIIQPTFQKKEIAHFFPTMLSETENMLKKWEYYEKNKIEFDLFEEMSSLALSIALKSLFNINIEKESEAIRWSFVTMLAKANKDMTSLLPESLSKIKDAFPTKENKQQKEAAKILQEFVFKIINNRREKDTTQDLLSVLINSNLSNQEIKDEVMTFVLAGHETTALTLTWAIYLLCHHKKELALFKEEIKNTLSSRELNLNNLQDLEYTKAVISETMRLYPAIWAVERQTIKADEIEGYYIPEKSMVIISPYLIHRNKKYWNKPSIFNPERFNKANIQNIVKYSYIPFSGGGRQCIGNHFASMETIVILALIEKKYDFDLVSYEKVEEESMITLRPKKPIIIKIDKKFKLDNKKT